MKQIGYIILLLILLTNMGMVSADDTFTITVTEKHIIGNDVSGYSGPLFILTDFTNTQSMGDVLVHAEDYYKIHQGDTVTLQTSDKYGYCTVLKINNMDNTDNSWW